MEEQKLPIEKELEGILGMQEPDGHNCRRAAEHLAEAFIAADELRHWEGGLTQGGKTLEIGVDNLLGYLNAFFKELGRRPFEGYAHDKANLANALSSAVPNPEFVRRYAEDLQKQIINQGFLDVIDCQCGK